jgi:hypothetical protein
MTIPANAASVGSVPGVSRAEGDPTVTRPALLDNFRCPAVMRENRRLRQALADMARQIDALNMHHVRTHHVRTKSDLNDAATITSDGLAVEPLVAGVHATPALLLPARKYVGRPFRGLSSSSGTYGVRARMVCAVPFSMLLLIHRRRLYMQRHMHARARHTHTLCGPHGWGDN